MTKAQRKQLQGALESIDNGLRELGRFWVDLPEPELDAIKESLLDADAYVREALEMPRRA
jgi:hypothetical protein